MQNPVKGKSAKKGTNSQHAQNGGNVFHMLNSPTGRYHCPRCDKTFKDQSELSRYYQVHTGRFSYWCEICAKGFVVKGHYSNHMGKHEGKKLLHLLRKEVLNQQ